MKISSLDPSVRRIALFTRAGVERRDRPKSMTADAIFGINDDVLHLSDLEIVLQKLGVKLEELEEG